MDRCQPIKDHTDGVLSKDWFLVGIFFKNTFIFPVQNCFLEILFVIRLQETPIQLN